MNRRRMAWGLVGVACLLGARAFSQTPETVGVRKDGSTSAVVVLTVSGHIAQHNAPQQYRWTLAMLEALPQHSFSTMTPWAAQPLQFSGPLLRDVLQAVGAQGQWLVARALNDYSVQIPVQDAQSHDVLVATRMNGQAMSVRQRGPLFVVYPFDSKAELKSPTYIERSIWQLRAIDVQ